MRQRQADADDLLIKIIAATLMIVAGAWGYSRFWPELNTPSLTVIAPPPIAAISPSIDPPTAAQAPVVEEPPAPPSPQPASGSAINGKVLYYCTYRGTTSVQTQACVAPWISGPEAPLPESDTSWEQRNRQLAEIKLAQAQADFAKASGLDRAIQVFAPAGQGSAQRQMNRCEAAKQNREWTLEQVGMHRTFDLIRRLNDEVYEACKGT